ncbi:MAG: EF-hand domain-containing protein, partial [Verrucomicrobiota bacterium]
DTDGSGGISLEEFQASPKAKDNPERAAEYFKKLDANGDGQITKEEFAANRPNPEEIFKKLDTDGSGGISLEEFQASPKGKENPERAAEFFKKLDANGDGQVTKEEFAKHRPQHPPGNKAARGDQGNGGGAAVE